MTREIKAVCPSCDYEVDAATEIGDGDAVPEDGDIALCIRCAMPAAYADQEDGTLGLRPLTAEEKVRLLDIPGFAETQAQLLSQSIWFKE
jgi:hypothetical protein